jgi:hypothetical protein
VKLWADQAAAATSSGSAIGLNPLVPISKCAFQGAIQHLNADVAEFRTVGRLLKKTLCTHER